MKDALAGQRIPRFEIREEEIGRREILVTDRFGVGKMEAPSPGSWQWVVYRNDEAIDRQPTKSEALAYVDGCLRAWPPLIMPRLESTESGERAECMDVKP